MTYKNIEKRFEKNQEKMKNITAYADAVAKKNSSNGRNIQELKTELHKLTQRANARVRYLEESGMSKMSPAYSSLSENKGTQPRFSEKAKTQKQIMNKIKEVEAFLQNKTSTTRYTKTFIQKQEKYMSKIGLDFEDDADKSEFFEMFNEFMSKSRQIKKNYSSTQIRDAMIDVFTKEKEKYGDVDKEKLFRKTRANIKKWEEEQNKREKSTFRTLTNFKTQSRTRAKRGR